MAICKICGVDKSKSSQNVADGKYVYVTEDNKRWNGKVCPTCIAPAKRKARGHEKESRICHFCGGVYLSAKKKQVVCSDKCRKDRRREVDRMVHRNKKAQVEGI